VIRHSIPSKPPSPEKVLQAGMDDLVTKPLQLATLAQTLAKWAPSPAGSPAARELVTPDETPGPRRNVSDEHSAPLRSERTTPLDEAPLLDPSTPRTERLWELFVQHSRDDVEFIKEAAAVADVESLRLRAHRLKGSSYAFGARRLGDKAAEVERQAIAGRCDAEGELAVLFEQTCALMGLERRSAQQR
jgi:two-component system, sensor histidine kinase and response regulator